MRISEKCLNKNKTNNNKHNNNFDNPLTSRRTDWGKKDSTWFTFFPD